MTSLPIQIDSLAVWLEQVDIALVEIAVCLSPGSGAKEDGEVESLLSLQDYLQTIKQNVLSGDLPSQRDRKVVSMSWIVSDGWDPNDPLGIRIELIDNYYLKKL